MLSPLQIERKIIFTSINLLPDTELFNHDSPAIEEKNKVWLDDDGLLSVAWEKEGTIDKYPLVWLRDNCQCKDCFDPSSRQRKLLLRDLDAEIKPSKVGFNHETNEVGYFTYL